MQSISHGSYWRQAAGRDGDAAMPPPTGDRSVDVAIIGAGITGLTAALHLKRAGKSVAVLEAGRLGAGATGGSSAHLDVMSDGGMQRLIRDFGRSDAAALTAARVAAIDQIEVWCNELRIDCVFRRIPAYRYTEHDDGMAAMRDECDAAQQVGVAATMVDQVPLPFACAGGMRIENQARFDPLRYLRGLANAVRGDRGAIYENTRALPPEHGPPATIETDHGCVTASAVIVATHSAFLGVSQLDLRVEPFISCVIAARVHDAIPDGLYWDDEQPYHYTRLANEPDVLIIGGADYRVGDGDGAAAMDRLEAYAGSRYGVRDITHRWTAEFFEPDDGVPYIGRTRADNLYIATGLSGTGLTWGTAAGRLIADLILHRENPIATICSPARIKPLAEAGSFLRHNLTAARHMVLDRLDRTSIESVDEVPPGTGRLVTMDGRQMAVYRDEDGGAHRMSPVCTHAGCIVQWNQTAKTWDCPCHGGRFAPTGQRIYGPPPDDLQSV